jgi:hypothetical protein
MNTAKSAVAVVQGLLILPALLFMGALVVRNLPLAQYDLAWNAQRIVMWYATRQWTLWTLLIILPLAVLVAGCVTLLSGWIGGLERPGAARQKLAAIGSQLLPIPARARNRRSDRQSGGWTSTRP